VTLRFTQRNPVLVRGTATGLQYRFSATEPEQSVDRRDADTLLRSGLFVRAD
jgi:hypothetical protein